MSTQIAGFLEDPEERRHLPFCGSTIVGGRERLDELRSAGVAHLIVAIGDCAARVQLAAVAVDKGFTLATAIHPQAIIAADVQVGAGSVIAAGAIVNPGTHIGDNVIINTAASVDHDCLIEDGAHVGPGCHVGGKASVGRQSWLGIGAIVRDRIVIGDYTIVGAGAVVIDDLPDRVIAYGVPARVMRRVENEST